MEEKLLLEIYRKGENVVANIRTSDDAELVAALVGAIATVRREMAHRYWEDAGDAVVAAALAAALSDMPSTRLDMGAISSAAEKMKGGGQA